MDVRKVCSKKIIEQLDVNIIGQIKIWMILARHKELKQVPGIILVRMVKN